MKDYVFIKLPRCDLLLTQKEMQKLLHNNDISKDIYKRGLQ